MNFVATCASGLEKLVEEEICSYGAEEIESSTGSVFFSGTLETAYRACLWSRFASRILMPLSEFPAPDTDALYEGAFSIDWPIHLSVDGTFSISAKIIDSAIDHSRFASLRVKDAVADYFTSHFKRRPSVKIIRPDIHLDVFIEKDRATVSLDLSGESLHRRGYRAAGVDAPLKESLAAAIVYLTKKNMGFDKNTILIDPMCGSGTLLIEAAMVFGDCAPGLGRTYFGFLKWLGHDNKLWESLVNEAVEREEKAQDSVWPRIIGYDTDRTAVTACSANIKKAGLTGRVHVERRDLTHLRNPFTTEQISDGNIGILLINPPYGHRLSEINEVKYLYRCLGRKMREELSGWRAGVFIGNPDLADSFGMEPKANYRLYNGPLPCQLRIFDVPVVSGTSDDESLFKPAMQNNKTDNDFANRLQKNIKAIFKWAEKENVSCFRIYDADIPDYNVAVDIYDHWVHIQEYAPPSSIDPEKAGKRLKIVIETVQNILGVHRRRVYVKQRKKQKGRGQYQKRAELGRVHEVREGSCRLLVNFTDYIDTGLFLDHRITRSIIEKNAEGKRFLNLFSYTGSATVFAAMGGAQTTTSVDLSQVYLNWAQSNMALNGFGNSNHKMVRADCMKWLQKEHDQFDLIFADPPTFSNSKSTGMTFDVQRHHVDLIRLAMKRLEPGGLLIFSTNFRRFKINLSELSEFDVTDISRKTIPKDFERNQKIHMCWELRRRKNDS